MKDNPALRLFEELLAVPAPSGREEALARTIADRLTAWGYAPAIDGSGNVLVQVEGRAPGAPLYCLAAHIDEVALVVTRIEPDGSLCVHASGGLLPWKLGEQPVQIVGDGEVLTGVVSFGSAHAALPGRALAWADARLLTGLTPAQLQAAGVRPGSTAVPLREGRGPIVFGDPADPLVAAWTFDDRMGAVTLLRLLEEMQRSGLRPYHPTLVAFTVHEEAGANGAKALARARRPEVFIAIDGCPIPAGAPLALDGRPGIWSKDSLTHYDQRLLQALCRAAVEAGSELQPVVYDNAWNDASQVYAVGGAARVACLGHVRENSHGYEVARLSVFDHLFNTLVRFIATWEDA
jgi:putative aminopeptidase FrvX